MNQDILAAIGAPAGFTLSDLNDGLVLANRGGEVRYYVRNSSAGFEVTRAERSEDERFGMATAHEEHVHRYLTIELGSSIRFGPELAPIWLPHMPDDLAPGFALEVEGPRATLSANGVVHGTFSHDPHMAPAVEFSWVAALPVDGLLQSFLDEKGEPFLARWLVEA
ncbi:Imm61 family immunity protein [Glaciihabitans arcticus]|uniref:Imm61 family immunity protein n=1 Tax=Glaciihabitans arcticus TaxID=2668039 RepID=UPI0013872CDD|nr:Imm61 family immunity protein [Glaciihabitans arcticus]